jgi:hypothetical protein
VADSLSEWTTDRQRRNANTTVVFHSDVVPDTLTAAISVADAFLAHVHMRLDPELKPHRNHPYWMGAIASFKEATGAALTLDKNLFLLGVYMQFSGRSR